MRPDLLELIGNVALSVKYWAADELEGGESFSATMVVRVPSTGDSFQLVGQNSPVRIVAEISGIYIVV